MTRGFVVLLLVAVVSSAPGGGVLWAPGAPPGQAGGQTGGAPSPEAMHLVDLAEFAPQVILDIRYATDRNVAGRELYPAPRALLARGTAHKLVAAAEALRAQGYGLVVWDAYRPLSVQRILWEIKPDPRFVADPAVGSRHNRAAAVDVTLVRLDGQPLAMPSDFDAFGPEADPAWEGHPREVREIALTLRQVMTDNGFLINPAEWWHFSDEEWRRYPILDLPLTVRVPAP